MQAFTSIYRPSFGLDSANKNLTGISSLINTIIPPLCWPRSRRKRRVYSRILNWPIRKDLSSLVSEKTNTSILFFICLTRRSNLFLIEFIFRCPITMFWRFSLQISFKLPLNESLDPLVRFFLFSGRKISNIYLCFVVREWK